MNFQIKPLKQSSLKRRINSDLDDAGTVKVDDDVQSLVLSGNLDEHPVYTDDEDELEDDDIYEDCVEEFDEKLFEVNDLNRAEEILFKTFGINCSIKKLIHLIISEKLSPSDLAVQALFYKVQSIMGGPKSVRYIPTWGMFWAGIRNITKSRGLVGFQEHFSIPSRLSKFKNMILNMCSMNKEMLGKPGLQKENLRLFVDGKQREVGDKSLCLSVSLDGKKIAVTGDGKEDMGGLGGNDTNSEKDRKYEYEKQAILKLVSGDTRKELFSLYDHMSQTGESVVLNISAVRKLITSNSKNLQKNPRLNKYIFVLNQKLNAGKVLLGSLNSIQERIIEMIAMKRRCLSLTHSSPTESCNLRQQTNYNKLVSLSQEEDSINVADLDSLVKDATSVMEISVSNLEDKLSRPLSEIPRESKTFERVLSLSYLTANIIHEACGLGKIRPLKDMQTFYEKCHSNLSTYRNHVPTSTNLSALATFCSRFSPMTFGGNLVIKEAGIYTGNGVISTPDLIVVDTDDNTEYCVVVIAVEDNTFDLTEEMVSHAMLTTHSCNAVKGCLLLLHSDISCTIFSVPSNAKLSGDFQCLIDSYTTASKCLSRRSPTISQKINSIRSQLVHQLGCVSTLGCYPLVVGTLSAVNLPCLVLTNGNFLKPHSKTEGCREVNLEILRKDIDKFLDEDRSFESKSARELVAVNVSDIAGNPSKFPHTILAGTYLSASSLKVVGKDIIEDTSALLVSLGAAVVNIGVDGESLGLVTTLSNGAPGTLVSLAKYVLRKLQLLSKQELVQICLKNRSIAISEETNFVEEEMMDEGEERDDIIEDVDLHMNDSVAAVNNSVPAGMELLTIEDLENMLSSSVDNVNKERETACKKLKKADLKFACLRFLLPRVKVIWLRKLMGIEGFKINLTDSEIMYIPHTVFLQPEKSYYQTISFDAAHLSNLLRESAAKNRLSNLGLKLQSLDKLSGIDGFQYLKKILKLKNLQSLEFDPMNQRSSALLFSLRTEEGLRKIKDDVGAKCCRLLREGIIEGLDASGIAAEDRIKQVYNLKIFLDEKIDIIDRLQKADKLCITTELLQMLYTSLDSHITTYTNLDHFNVRRKSTGTVEQFFSQITLMCEGGSKLNCREISDILSRVSLTNALRLTPKSVKGFSFLARLGVHMTSYLNDEVQGGEDLDEEYPQLHGKRDIHPRDSPFDRKPSRPRRSNIIVNDKMFPASASIVTFDGNVRKYHKKF